MNYRPRIECNRKRRAEKSDPEEKKGKGRKYEERTGAERKEERREKTEERKERKGNY